MVQFIRPQTRQYAADQTDAIETAQVAKNIGEWGNIISSAGKLYSAIQKDFVETPRREAEAADKKIINAQIGQNADLLADRDIQREVSEGKINPDTEEGRKRIEEIVASKYEQYKGLGQTTEYEDALTQMQRNASDKSLKNAFATYDRVQKEKARVAAQKMGKGFGEAAYKQGVMGQNQPIEGTEEYIKFIASDKGIPEEQAKVLVDGEIARAKIRGIVESNPVAGAYLLGDEEIMQEAYLMQHPEVQDETSDSLENLGGLGKIIKTAKEGYSAYKTADEKKKLQEASEKEFKEILGDDYFNAIIEAQKGVLEAEKQSYELELKKIPVNTPLAKKYKEKIKDLESAIENPESSALKSVRSHFLSFNDNELQRTLKESYARFKQDMTVDSYDTTWKLYSTAMDTDVESAKHAQTEIWLAQNNLVPMTPIESKMMSDFNGEVNKKEMIDSYHEFLENTSKVKPELHETYEATMEIHSAVQELFEPGLTPMQLVKKGFDVINKTARTAGCTDGRLRETQSLVAKIIQDRNFGDLASSVMNSIDRAWFDESFVGDFAEQNTSALVPQLLWASNKEEKMALPEGREYRTTKDSVQKMIKSEGQKVTQRVMSGLLEAYSLPEEQRMMKIQELQNYVVDSKRKIYNRAMKNYGIDLNYLDNELQTRGRAYVNINGILREYRGRDSEQRALWATPKRDPVEKQQLDKLFERIKTEK